MFVFLQVTDTCIGSLAPSLAMMENLDLRGCKQVKLFKVLIILSLGLKRF